MSHAPAASPIPDTSTPMNPSIRARFGAFLPCVLDALLVVVFAVTGRASHAEMLDVTGVWATAWPFLVGLVITWAATRAWRRPLGIVWPGVALWVGTVAIGMLLRLATGEGAALPFIIVATITLAVLLLGWRGIAALARRLRRTSAGSR